MIADTPGIYQLSMAQYYADPCDRPSLSAHLAHQLIARSPFHAWHRHPKLNPEWAPTFDDKFDLGTVAHSILLDGGRHIEVIDANDYRSKAAQAARDLARAGGFTPILRDQHERAKDMVSALKSQMQYHQDRPTPFTVGRAEQTLVWHEEGGVACRARLDFLHDAAPVIDDYKTTTGDANPSTWTRRQLFDLGYDLQAVFHLRGLSMALGQDLPSRFRFVVQEAEPPYAAVVISLGPEALVLAEKKRRYAVALWRACLETGKWPGYPDDTCYATLPEWEETRWLARELAAEAAPRDRGQGEVSEL